MAYFPANPNWPAHYQTGVVFGKFVRTDGSAQVGSISFTPLAPVVLVPNDATIVSADTVNVLLDSNGEFNIELPATDDPDTQPQKFTYHVVENWENGGAYDIHVPMGENTNILDVRPVQPSIGLVQYFGPRGVPGPPGPAADVIDGGGA